MNIQRNKMFLASDKCCWARPNEGSWPPGCRLRSPDTRICQQQRSRVSSVRCLEVAIEPYFSTSPHPAPPRRPQPTDPIYETKMYLEIANLYLNLLVDSVPRAVQQATTTACPKVPGIDPAAPWIAPNCTMFPYTGLENDLARLAEVQVSKGRVQLSQM